MSLRVQQTGHACLLVQVAIALGGDVVYFELDQMGQLLETEKKEVRGQLGQGSFLRSSSRSHTLVLTGLVIKVCFRRNPAREVRGFPLAKYLLCKPSSANSTFVLPLPMFPVSQCTATAHAPRLIDPPRINVLTRMQMGDDVSCLNIAPIPEGLARCRFLAVGCYDSTVRILGLNPEDALRGLALQVSKVGRRCRKGAWKKGR